MNRRVASFITVAMILFFAVQTAAQEIAPDFTLTDIDGVEFSLSDYRGRIVFLNFFSINCRFCIAMIPYLKSLYEEFGEDLTIISVSKVDNIDAIRRFRESYDIEWIVAKDDIGLREEYNVSYPYHPTEILIDRKGFIQYNHAGFMLGADLRREVIRVLQGSPPTVNDVAVVEVKPRRTVISNGTLTSVNVTVTNQGDVEVDCNVSLYCNSTYVYTQAAIIEARESRVLVFEWTTPILVGNYSIEAVASQLQGEADTGDNALTYYPVHISIQSDINADGTVNILDLSRVAAAYATKIGDNNWDANADVNEDQTVDILDLTAVATECGKISF